MNKFIEWPRARAYALGLAKPTPFFFSEPEVVLFYRKWAVLDRFRAVYEKKFKGGWLQGQRAPFSAYPRSRGVGLGVFFILCSSIFFRIFTISFPSCLFFIQRKEKWSCRMEITGKDDPKVPASSPKTPNRQCVVCKAFLLKSDPHTSCPVCRPWQREEGG